MTLAELKEKLTSLGVTELSRGNCDQDGASRYASLTQNVPDDAVTHLQQYLSTQGKAVDVDGAYGQGTQVAVQALFGSPNFVVATAEEPEPPSVEGLEPQVMIEAVPNIKQYGWKDPEPETVPEQHEGALMVNTKTWSAVGCLATNHCIVGSRLIGRQILPPELALFYRQNDGWVDENGKPGGNLFSSDHYLPFLRSLGYSGAIQRKNGTCNGVDDPAALLEISKLLQNGTTPILHMSHDKGPRGRHFVVAHGFAVNADGSVEIFFRDPGAGDHRGNKLSQNAHGYGITAFRYWEEIVTNVGQVDNAPLTQQEV